MYKLIEAPWYTGNYRKITRYFQDIGRLSSLESIYIVDDPSEMDVEKLSEHVYALALHKVDGKAVIWFRESPPPYSTFTHELLHIIDKDIAMDEEIFCHNFSHPLTFLILKDLASHDYIKIFEMEPNIEKLIDILNKIYNVNNLIEYFRIQGVIPPFFTVSKEGGFEIDWGYGVANIYWYTVFDLFIRLTYIQEPRSSRPYQAIIHLLRD